MNDKESEVPGPRTTHLFGNVVDAPGPAQTKDSVSARLSCSRFPVQPCSSSLSSSSFLQLINPL